jgi:hypothetical protein
LHTIRVRRRLLSFEHLHVANVVDVKFRFQHHYQSFPVQSHGQYGRAECHLTYRRMPLPIVSASSSKYGYSLLTLVFCIRSTRGDSVRATNEVEKSISRLDTSPSRDSDCLLNGSVV